MRPQKPEAPLFPRTANSRLHRLAIILAAAGILATGSSSPGATPGGTWTKINNAPPAGLDNPLLMTDGSIMCGNGGNAWYLYKPDSKGSYLNGTWSTLASTSYTRLFFSSQVLPTGNVYVAGGEYGNGTNFAELYNYLNNSWSVIPTTSGAGGYGDAVSILLPNGNVLQGSTSANTFIYETSSNQIIGTGGVGQPARTQDEACWCRLPNDNILTVDGFGQTSEHYVPANNAWYADGTTPVDLYGYGAELGPLIVLPNGNAFQIGATSNTCTYTPGSSVTAAGSWVQTANIPNNLGAVDAPACMMPDGNILSALGTTSGYGSTSYFYEYDYTTDTFTQVTAPAGGTSYGTPEFELAMVQLPDGGVFLIGGQGTTSCYIYYPTAAPLPQGQPTITNYTPNSDGSYTLTGVGLCGISVGAAYGDDWQMASNYPIVRLVDASGNVTYCRTYNWSSSAIQNPNPVTVQFTLPSGFANGNYTLQVVANGNPSAGAAFSTAGTVTAAVSGLAVSAKASSHLSLQWTSLNENQTGYQVQRSTDDVNFSTLATVGASTTSYTDSTTSPLSACYYRVCGVNPVGNGPFSPIAFAATPPSTPLSAPWSSQDIGAVGGSGASGQTSGVYTLFGAGSGLVGAGDQGQYASQSITGNVTIQARAAMSQNGAAGVVIRDSCGTGPITAAMVFSPTTGTAQFITRSTAGANSTTSSISGLSSPVWVELARTNDTVTGFYSTNGTTWTQVGSTAYVALEPTALVGLFVTSNSNSLLANAAIDHVSVQGTTAPVPAQVAYWKLDDLTGSVAADARGTFNGSYIGGVTLAQAGAVPVTNYAVGLDGSTGYVDVPPMYLNTNTATMSGWIKSSANQPYRTGLIFCRAGTTIAGLRMGATTNDNLLGYVWGPNNLSNSSLTVPNGQWTFVALVVQPSQATVYMMPEGGSLQSATFTNSNPTQPFDGDLDLGQDPNGGSGGRFFNGVMDDVQIYNVALSSAQIQALAGLPSTSLSSPSAPNLAGSTIGPNINIPANVGLVLQANNGNASSLQWIEANGPAVATFGSPASAATSAFFNATGVYSLVLQSVNSAGLPSPIPLTVNAGSVYYPLVGGDIGGPAIAGSTTYTINGQYSVIGGGATIGGTADQFQFGSVPLGSATRVQARVVSAQASGAPAKAGVMIRDTAAAGAIYAELHLTDSSGVTFSWRNATNGASANAHINNVSPPIWVRLTVSPNPNGGGIAGPSNLYSAYYGADGVNWTQIGSAQALNIGSAALAGLEECSGNNAVSTTAVIDNFGLNPATINVGPLVGAGSNFTSNTETASLTGSVSDDGLPTPSNLTSAWSLVSGPGSVTFSSPSSPVSNATASANGTYDLRLSASDGQVTTCNDILVTFSAPWLSWRSANFNAAQLQNTAISGTTATPANDGVCNLLKYAYGLSPFTPVSQSDVPFGGVSGSHVTITYLRNEAATDLTWQVQQSSDLVNWAPAAYTEQILAISNNVQTVQDAVAIGSANQLFLRLAVSMP